jgi:H+/gluconate symporter-like permease
MAALGILVGVIVLSWLALRGINVLVAALIAAAIVAVTNGRPLPEALSKDFVGSMMGFAGQFLLVFLMGAIFGRVMAESRAATSIALALGRRLGAERVMLIIVLACGLLTYGGVNVFVVIFTIYPLGLSLMQHANLPKRLLVGPITLGSGTFTMTALPGSPSLQNIMTAQGLGTPLTAAPGIGLAASIVMVCLGMWYLERQRLAARRRGEGFQPGPGDTIPEASAAAAMPHPGVAILPLVVVLATIITPPWLAAVAAGADRPQSPVLEFARTQPVLWICVAMLLGTLLAIGLFQRHLLAPWVAVSRGAEGAILPLVNTGAVIGFGGVVKATAAFAWFSGLMIDSALPPLLSAALSINIMAGTVGSATGGLGIFLQSLAGRYLDLGIPPEVLHRIVTIGSGGLDSLPHSGAVVSFLAVTGLTHREAYRDIAIVSIVVPLVTLAGVLAVLAGLGIR